MNRDGRAATSKNITPEMARAEAERLQGKKQPRISRIFPDVPAPAMV